MCGIAGFFAHDGLDATAAQAVATAMSQAIHHRGPDSSAEWADADAGIMLVHRRLAIIDLSAAGAQPMTSASGRWVISYNGEIYNFEALRSQLNAAGQNPDWRGHSDTEVLLACIDAWGVEATLGKLNGMFAFAIWDRRERELWLARDRFGEKPLYYGWAGRTFVFGSELKALRCHPDFDMSIDRAAFGSYVKYGFVPHDSSIHSGIRKLPPAGWIRLASDAESGFLPEPSLCWDIDATIADARRNPFGGSLDDAADALDQVLGDAVENRMVADVPLCGLLSGGVDSSLIVALMQARSSQPVSTYSIGSTEPGFDEAKIAKQIGQHLGTRHTEFYVDPSDALEIVPQLGAMYDEPFADSSQIPTHIVSRLVRQSGTVALSGDAGDELFGGYNRYFHGARIAGMINRLPFSLRKAAASCMTALPPDAINRLLHPVRGVLPAELRSGAAGEKVHKLAASLSASSEMAFGEMLLAQWPRPEEVLVGEPQVANLTDIYSPPAALTGFAETMMYHDTRFYMTDDVLAKVDRASMAASLEVRVPFLDPEVFAFAWSLPLSMKTGRGVGKLVLRRLLSRYVPDHLMDRPKQGFAVPVGRWLRGDLRDWAEALIDPARLGREGYFDVSAVRRCWDEHVSGRRNHDARLWTILMFQAWQDEIASSGRPGAR
jgi:asparagine synthase (glutamine-hydrolysing)